MWLGYLFTDIEGSTERWERAATHMPKAIARHDAIVDALIARHGGEVLSRAGDGVFAVFRTGNPLACALALQLALQAEDWSDVDGIWVRIGVHASAAASAGGDGAGEAAVDQVAINRAARIMACGWGGQIVVSGEASRAYNAPAGAQLEDLGLGRLRGIDEPLHLWSLIHPELKRTEFPPPRTLTGQAAGAPAPATPLFGRAVELEEIGARLEGLRPVTIVGPGGNGKTRLAIEIAQRASALQPVHFVTLDGVSTGAEAVSQIAATMRFPFHGPAPRQDQLLAYLQDKSALLVLDNADGLGGDPGLLDTLASRCPRLSILATSRGSLGHASESLYPLHGLPLPRRTDADMAASPAFQFFLHEAKAVNAAFALGAEGLPTLHEICRLLSGSPLALRLAAHWSRFLTLDEILQRVRAGLDFLDAPEADTSAGRSNLRGVFNSSWTLLTHDLQAALARLSVFAGDFDAEATLFVAQADATVLSRLERRGLISQSGRRRFQLHAIIREYAHEKLSALPEEADTRQRHADYYLGMVRSGIAGLAPAEQGRVLDQLQAHIANVRAAWKHTVASASAGDVAKVIEPLFYFMALRSLFYEAAELFRVQAQDREIGLYCRSLLANCLIHLGAFDEAEAMAQQVVAEEPARPLVRAHALQALAGLAHARGDFSRALDQYNAVLEMRTRAEDLMGAAYTVTSLAALHLQRGETAEARERVKDAFRMSRRIGNMTGMMTATVFAGDVALREERLEDARRNYAESLRLEETVHNPQYRTGALLRLGSVDARLGDGANAADHIREALELATDIGDRRLQTHALLELGALLAGQGERAAGSHLVDGVRLALSIGAQPLVARGLLELGRIELRGGDRRAAARIAAALGASDVGSLQSAYADFLAQLGEGNPAPVTGDLRQAIDTILEDAEMGALNL